MLAQFLVNWTYFLGTGPTFLETTIYSTDTYCSTILSQKCQVQKTLFYFVIFLFYYKMFDQSKIIRSFFLQHKPWNFPGFFSWNSCEQAFCNNGSRDIVTSKMMCNHNILVQMQVSAYYVIYSGNGSIFKSLNLIEFIWLEGKPCLPATFSYTNPLNISEI